MSLIKRFKELDFDPADDSMFCMFLVTSFWPIREFSQSFRHLNIIGKILIFPALMIIGLILSLPFAALSFIILPIEILCYILIGLGMLAEKIFFKKH